MARNVDVKFESNNCSGLLRISSYDSNLTFPDGSEPGLQKLARPHSQIPGPQEPLGAKVPGLQVRSRARPSRNQPLSIGGPDEASWERSAVPKWAPSIADPDEATLISLLEEREAL